MEILNHFELHLRPFQYCCWIIYWLLNIKVLSRPGRGWKDLWGEGSDKEVVTDEERGGEDVEDRSDGVGAEVEGEGSQTS